MKLLPEEPTQEMISAMACSEAKDDEGQFPPLMDLIGYSGENKTHTALKAAYSAIYAAAPEVKDEPLPVPPVEFAEMVKRHLSPAGVTVELARNKEAFAAFLKECEIRENSLREAAQKIIDNAPLYLRGNAINPPPRKDEK